MAKEQAILAKRKERLLQLQKYVTERIEGKRKRPRSTSVKVYIISEPFVCVCVCVWE